MPTTPHRLQPDTPLPDNLALINDNFDKAAQDIRDLGGNVTTSVTIPFTILASSVSAQTVVVATPGTSLGSPYVIRTQQEISGVSALTPALDIFVDNDNNENFRWPNGPSLTTGQLNMFANACTTTAKYTGGVAALLVQIVNRDSSTHTYYVHASAGYIPTGATGAFR